GALVFVRQRGRRGGGPGLAPSAQPVVPAASAVRRRHGAAHRVALLRGGREPAQRNPGQNEAAQRIVAAALRAGGGDFSGGAGGADERLPALRQRSGGSGGRAQRAQGARKSKGLRKRPRPLRNSLRFSGPAG